jgi:hypothetical protein
MAYSDFMDVLGKLHKLTPAQRRAVAEVLAEPEEVQRPAEASEDASGQSYTKGQQAEFDRVAQTWGRLLLIERARVVETLAMLCGRTEKAIRYQITSRLK